MPRNSKLAPVLEAVVLGSGVVMLLACIYVVSQKAAQPPFPQPRDNGNDFIAFYGAGSLVLHGHGKDIYDNGQLQRAQEKAFVHSGARVKFIVFPYPPVMAAPYAPLALLPYRIAYAAHAAFMLACLLAAAALMTRLVVDPRGPVFAVTLAAMAFPPVIVSIATGQNATLSLLGIATLWYLWTEKQLFAAGLVSAAMLYKPQIGVLWLAIWVISRERRAIAGWMAGAATMYLACAAVSGWDWPVRWIPRVHDSRGLAEVFSANAVAWGDLALRIPAGWARTAFTVVFVGGTWAVIGWVWWKSRWQDRSATMAVTLPLLVMGSPHAMFYDAALVLPAIAWLRQRSRTRAALVLLLGLGCLIDPVFAPAAVVLSAIFIGGQVGRDGAP